MRQTSFFDDEFNEDMEIKRHTRRTDPPNSHQGAEDIVLGGGMDSQCRAILDRLRSGPMVTAELLVLAPKYSSRLADLRHQGYVVKATRVRPGCWSYTLEE